MTESISPKDVALLAARIIDEKKGADIVIQDVSDLLKITDYFVICTALNRRRAEAIADELVEKLSIKGGIKPMSVEGIDDAKWILLDYGSVVVHIFQPVERDFYRLEQLWDEAPAIDVADAGVKDPVYSERIAALLGRRKSDEADDADVIDTNDEA